MSRDEIIDELLEAYGKLELAHDELSESLLPEDTTEDMFDDINRATDRYRRAVTLLRADIFR